MPRKTSANPDWRLIWSAVEDARLERGWTKRDLYKHADISHTAYQAMQAGTPLRRADKIHSLATALGWTVDDLDRIGRGGDPPTPDTPSVNALSELETQLETMQDVVLSLHRTVREHSQTIRELRQTILALTEKLQ